MKRGKRAQFYILAAVIIIALIASLTTVSNYIVTKQTSEKTGQTFEDFNNEMSYAMDYCINQDITIDICIANIASLFSNYTEQNTRENFNLTIYFGNGNGNTINSTTYYRANSGTISPGWGGIVSTSGGRVDKTTNIYTNHEKKKKYIDMTINDVNYSVPVLKDNNFIAVMVTTDGYNNYVFTNLIRAN
jgi:hypothetical protein